MQCLLALLRTDHARLPNALVQPVDSVGYTSAAHYLHERVARRVKGLVGREDGAHSIRINLGQQSAGRTPAEGSWTETRKEQRWS